MEDFFEELNISEITDIEEERLETIRRLFGSEVDEETGQEIVGGVICIEDVDII